MLSKETLITHKCISELEETRASVPSTLGGKLHRGFGATNTELDSFLAVPLTSWVALSK